MIVDISQEMYIRKTTRQERDRYLGEGLISEAYMQKIITSAEYFRLYMIIVKTGMLAVSKGMFDKLSKVRI